MMHPRHSNGLLAVGVLLLLLFAGLALGQELFDRVERLRREAHYELAEELLQDHLDRGTPLTPQLQWARAQLTRDPDRFDRLAAELSGGASVEDPRTQEIVLARAREYFARGRYLSSVELLQTLPRGGSEILAEAALFHGMAAAAAGSAREAREQFLLVPEGSAQYAMSQTLLAYLSLRTADPAAAVKHAETALAQGSDDVAPQALYARAQALGQQGENERAQRTYEEILRSHGRSAEAAWVREARLQAARDAAQVSQGIPEEEAPESRPGFALQLGAFHDRSLALRLAGTLEGQVQDLRIERDAVSSPPWYRVVVGRFPTRSAAESERERLAGKGWDSVVLSPGQG